MYASDTDSETNMDGYPGSLTSEETITKIGSSVDVLVLDHYDSIAAGSNSV